MPLKTLTFSALALSLWMASPATAMGAKRSLQSQPEAVLDAAALAQAPADGQGVYAFKSPDIDGKEQSLSQYKGKVLLIMNTASKCGTTPQYGDLESLYKAYKDQGLEILAFPSDDFGHQEPGSNATIKQFCVVEYGITFPIFSKCKVLGPDRLPLYGYLSHRPGLEGDPQWNGVKFLVNRQGKVVARFSSWTKPDDPKVVAAIKTLLAAKAK